jgi:tetratricopeptide (TPR) repeat protein
MFTWQPQVRWIVRAVVVVLLVAAVTLAVWSQQRQKPQYLAARAREALEAGDDDRAEIYLRNLVRKAPEDAGAKIALADLFVRQAQRAGRPASYAVDARAMQLLAAAAAQRPDDSALQAKLMTADLESGREEDALGIARDLVRAGSRDETVLYLVARKAIAAGSYLQAEEMLQRLATVQSDPPLRVLLLQAQLWSKRGQKARLVQVLEQAGRKAAAELARLSKAERQALRAIPVLGIQAAQGPEEAHRLAQQALSLFEQMSQAEDAKGKATLVQAAAEVLALVGQAQPLKPPVAAALLEERRGLVTRFAALARPLLGSGEIGPLSYYLLAEAALAQGDETAALKDLQEGLARGEKPPKAPAKELAPLHLLAAQRLLSQRRFVEAEPHWKFLLGDEATAAWGHRLAGAAALEEGRWEEAANHISAALPAFDGTVELHAALAGICLRLGRWERAADELKIVLAGRDAISDEERPAIERHLGAMERIPALLGDAQLALGRYAEVPPLVGMLTAGGQEPAALRLLVAYHSRRGERTQAARYLSEGREKHPHDFGLLLEEVKMLRAQSAEDEALNRLQQFVQENPKHLAAAAMLIRWRAARGEHEAAATLADDMATRFPDDPGVKLLRADVRLTAGKLDEALPILDELRRGGAPPEAVAVLQARAALLSHRLDDAAAALAQTSVRFQQSGLGKLWKGELSRAQGDFQAAAAEFADSFQVSALRPAARAGLVQALAMLLQKEPAAVEAQVSQLLANFPDEPLLLVIAAELALRQGRFEQGLSLLDRAERLQPNALLIAHAKARAWLQKGQPEHALQQVERALRADPRDLPSRFLAAEVHLARHDPRAALRQVEQVLAGRPELVDAQVLRAEILRRLGRAGEAVAQLDDLLARRPDAFAAYLLLAEIHDEQGNGAKALEVARLGQRQFPDQPTLRVKEVSVLCRLGRVAEAEEAAGQLGGPKPDADLCLALAAAFLGAGELPAARRWAEQAMALGDQSRQTPARLLLANISLVQGRRAKDKTLLAQSRDFYSQVFQAQPENLLAANNLAWLWASEFAEPAKAGEIVAQALRKTSTKQLPANVADTFAMVYRQTGQLDEAQQIVEEALRRTPDHAVLNFQAGLIYGRKQRADHARSAFQKAISLGLPAEQAAEAAAELQRLEAPPESPQPPSPGNAAENDAKPNRG